MTPTIHIGRRFLQAVAVAAAISATAVAQTEQQRPVSQNPTQVTQATQAKPPTIPTKAGAATGAIQLDRPIALPTDVRVGTPGTTTTVKAPQLPRQPALKPAPTPGTPVGGVTAGRSVQIINVKPLDASTTPGAGLTPGYVIDRGDRRNPPEIEVPKETPRPAVLLPKPAAPANVKVDAPNVKVDTPNFRVDAPANTKIDAPRNVDTAVVNTREPEAARQIVVAGNPAPVSGNTAVNRGTTSGTDQATSRRADPPAAGQMRARGDALSTIAPRTDPAYHLGLAQVANAQRNGEEANRQGQLAALRDAMARRAANAAAGVAANAGTAVADDSSTARDAAVDEDVTGAITEDSEAGDLPVAAEETSVATTTGGEAVAATRTTTQAARATARTAAGVRGPGVTATVTTSSTTTAPLATMIPQAAFWLAGVAVLGLGFVAMMTRRKTSPADVQGQADAYEKWAAKEGPPPQVTTMLDADARRNQLLTLAEHDEVEAPTETPDDAFDRYIDRFDASLATDSGAEDISDAPTGEPAAEELPSEEEVDKAIADLDETVFDVVDAGDESATGEGARTTNSEPPAEQEQPESPETAAVSEAVDTWLTSIPGAGGNHPLRGALIEFGAAIGLDKLNDLLGGVKAEDPLGAFVGILEGLGTPEAIGLAVVVLGLDHPRAKELLERLEQSMTTAEDEEQRDTLKGIQEGTLSVEELDRIAKDALTKGKLGLYVAASFAAAGKTGEPLAKKASRLADVVTTLQLIRDEQSSDSEEIQQDPMAQVGFVVLQRQAGKLLDGLAPRIETLLGQDFQAALDKALEDLARAGAAIGEEATDTELAKRQESIANVRNLAMFRAGLFASSLDGDARTAALQKMLRQAEGELTAYEKQIANRDDFPALDRERALARLNGLRAMRDAVEDLLIDAGGLSGDAVIRTIFTRLNGGSGEAGLRRQLDRAEQAGNVGETRRLQDALDYLEHRRVSILARTSGAEAIRRFKDIKEGEANYWRTLSGEEAGRIRQSVEMYGAMLIPVALTSIRQALIEQGMEPEEVAQQFIRGLAQVTNDDVQAGRRQWFDYKSRPWYRRGWIVGNYRLWHSHDIEREILEDARYAESLRLAGEHPIETLKSHHAGAYQRLLKKGFISNDRYVIPEHFVYSSETAGSAYGADCWLDGLNAVTFGEILATVIIPAGAAARVARGIKAGVDAARATRVGVAGVRLIVEAGAFTAFNRGAQRIVHGPAQESRSFARDFAANLAIIGGLRVFSKLFQIPERALLSRTAAKQITGTTGRSMTPAQMDKAISRFLWGAANKPLSQLTRTELGALGKKAGLEAVKAGTEAGAFTAFNTLPIIGHNGRFDWQAFKENLLFVGQMRWLHVGGKHGAERARELLLKRGSSPYTTTRQAPETTEIAEPNESAVAKVPQAQFRSWYRGIAQRIPITTPAKLARFLQREFTRIANDPTASVAKREAARSMALILEGGRVNVEFKKGEQGKRGNYDTETGTASIHVDEIVVRLYNRFAKNLKRQPSPQEVLDSLLGTTVHEALEHGLQGLDGSTPKPYSKLHEGRAYSTQRLFDPTLGGKNRTYEPGKEVTPDDIAAVVNEHYGDVQSKNRKTLETLYPDRVTRWKAAQARIQSGLNAQLKTIHRQRLLGKRRQAAIGKAVAGARAARAAAMSIIFRTSKTPPVEGKVSRLRQVRQELRRQMQRQSRVTRDDARNEAPLPAWAERALRRLIGELGIPWKKGEPFGLDQQAAINALLVARFRQIAADTTLPANITEAASEVVFLLGGPRQHVRTQFVDNAAGLPVGAYFSNGRIAEVYLRSIAHVTERMAQMNDGRMSTAEDFITVLMGVTAHEVLEHGFRQQLGIRRDTRIPVLGTRPSTRLQELSAFVTQRRFDPRLGGLLDGVTPRRTRQALIEHVDRQYDRPTIEVDNEQLLFWIDRIDGQHWLNFRRLLDGHFGGRQTGPDARAKLLEAFEKLPISAEQRQRFEHLLQERDATSLTAEEFNPLGDSFETRAADGKSADGRPALTVEMLKASMLSELIFTRTHRLGSDPAHVVRRSINRLRTRAGRMPMGPELPAPPKKPSASDAGAPATPASRQTGKASVLPGPETPIARERRLIRAKAIADRGVMHADFRAREVDQTLAVLDRLLAEARADGVAEAELARILGWIRGTGTRINDDFLPRVENMLKVARANARGLTIVIDEGKDALEAFRDFAWFVEPVCLRQISLPVLWQVKVKAALEARATRPRYEWSDGELDVAHEVAAAGRDALSWMERSLEDSDGHGLSQLFTAEDVVNIEAIARRHPRSASWGAVR